MQIIFGAYYTYIRFLCIYIPNVICFRTLTVEKEPNLTETEPTSHNSTKHRQNKYSYKRKMNDNGHQKRVNQCYRIAIQFFSITIIFIISIISQIVGSIYGSLLLKYMYFINYLGNPVIYFIVDKSFRIALVKLLQGQHNINANRRVGLNGGRLNKIHAHVNVQVIRH